MVKKIWACFVALFCAALALITGGLKASAVNSSTTLADNPASPQSVRLTRVINGVTNPVDTHFLYTVVADASNPAPVSGLINAHTLTFEGQEPDDNNVAVAEMQMDFSTISFSKVGTYRFIVREVESQSPLHFPADKTRRYTVEIVVSNVLDENDNPTGEIFAGMSGLAKLGGGKSDLFFESTAGNSYIEISKRVQGAAGDTDAYFKVNLFVAGTGNEVYTISGLDDYAFFRGENVENPASIKSNTTIPIYIKHGQTAKVGVRGDGMLELPLGSMYSVIEVSPGADGYQAFINGEPNGLVSKNIAAAPEAGGTEDDFNANNKIDILNKKDGSGVDTGVAIAIAPFIVLLAVGVAGFMALKRSSLSKNKK